MNWGHAYHFELLKDSTFIHQNYPMTLAETASIFSEILLFSRAIEDKDITDRTPILEMFLQENFTGNSGYPFKILF